jgi:hypothetical protein
LLYQCVRFTPKDFRRRRPDGNGGWEWNLKGVRRVVYRLPEVRAAIDRGADVIYVPEGERDVERIKAATLDEVATTSRRKAGDLGL